MLRVIRELRPTCVVAENVRGLLSIESGVVFEHCVTDLEAAGYEVWPVVIPACAVNAPHQRKRVWILAWRPDAERLQGHGEHGERAGKWVAWPSDRHAPDAAYLMLNGAGGSRPAGREEHTDGSQWDAPWLEVATRFCRVDDGIPAWVYARRVARLKALGNAIVPQVAYEIIKGIAEIERS